MTDRNKFQEMLERLINEDREGAEELFHEIVVERSREIYQSIIESEDEEVDESEDDDLDESDDEDLDESDDDELDESTDEEVDESEDDDLDEMFGLGEFELEADPMGGDATDDMMGDMGMDDEGGMDMGMDGEEGEEGEEDGADGAFADLESAIDALKAEFEAMLGGDDEEGDMGGEEGDMDGEEEPEEEPEEESYAFESEDEEVDESEDDDLEEAKHNKKDDKKDKKTAGEEMREYVEKVNGGFGAKIGGDNGTNSKSIVAKPNNMGGTTANIVKGGTEAGVEAAKGQLKGSSLFKGTAKEDNAGNINVPGGKAGKTAFKKSEPGHGPEKKGKPETADKSAGSMLNGAPRRAK